MSGYSEWQRTVYAKEPHPEDYEVPFCLDGNTMTADIGVVIVLQK